MNDDLIKREDAIKAMQERYFLVHDFYTATAIIRSVPSADIDLSEYYDKLWKTAYERGKADRPQGEWKSVKASIYPYGYDVKCSVCGFIMGSSYGFKYCPHCGAEMKGEESDE